MKWSFTGETKVEFGITFKRIQRKDTKELGGWIEKESNLSQDGDAWVSGNAQVFGDAWVSGDAQVFGDAWVYGNAQVSGDAWVSGNARVSGNAQVSGDAWVSFNLGCQVVRDSLGIITVTESNIQFGCQLWDHTTALKLKYKDVQEFGLSLKKFKFLKQLIKSLIMITTQQIGE